MQNAAYSRFTIAKFLIFCQSAHADAKPGYDNARCYAIQITATRSCNCEFVAISRYISETMQASAKVVCCYTVVATTTGCSFPFTYNGGLYYNCTNNMTGVSTDDEPFACLAVNATPVVCSALGELYSSHSVYTFCRFIYSVLFVN